MKREYTDPSTGVVRKVPKITSALIKLNENNGPGLYNLGTYELHQKNFDNAKKLFKKSLQVERTPETLLNMSTCYKLTYDAKTAYLLLAKCMQEFPEFALAYNNSGLIDYDYRRLDLAIEKYLKALELKPDYADAHWNYALALYLKFFNKANTGIYDKAEFDGALSHFNWRFRKSNPVRVAYHVGTVWEGQALLPGEQVMILSEQGYGDIIQFLRYAYSFAPSQVVLHIPQDVHCMVKPGYECTINSTDPQTKYYIPLMSAAQYFPFSGEPYISHSETADLGSADFKIGIVWKGNKAHANDRNRSMHYKDFYWLFKHGKVFSLQKDVECNAKDITNLKINTWKDTMAYINALDIVVTIDTSVAHLCGAMGKACIVLIPSIGIDWRWGETGDRTIWYDSLRLARDRSQSEAERLLLEYKNAYRN